MSDYRPGPGRPPKPGGTETWKIYIPLELATFHRLFLTDPVSGKIPLGVLSGFVERLLREEKERMEQEHKRSKRETSVR